MGDKWQDQIITLQGSGAGGHKSREKIHSDLEEQ